MKQDLCPNWYQLLHYPPSPWKVVPHGTGVLNSLPPLFTNSSVGSCTSHKSQNSERAVRRGVRFFVLIHLTTCRCHNKGSTFFLVIFRLWVFELERLTFVWKTRKFWGEFKWSGSSRWKFSAKKVMPFEVSPFSRFYRHDRNFLYHLFGLLGFMSRESEKLTGIL